MLLRSFSSLTILLIGVAHAELMPPTVREPQFPLKTQRMLLTDDEIATARENVERYESAKGIAAKIVRRADAWLAWEDAALRAIVPTADVPRAFNVGTAGCPTCSKKIYAKGGTYPWIIDPKKPFKVTCPVDNNTFPSNDYGAYYGSGLNDEKHLGGDYADDGWGWVGPDGERYWFVAYANHWTWRNHVIPAAQYLARAYILTGDRAYGKKAIVLLDRIAEVYPNMDYHGQSRYGQLQAANGGRYEGKIINLIWATGVLTMLSEAYDYAWDAVDDSTVAGKTGEEVRVNIEANLLEDGIDAYFSGKVRGNYGMHQKALVYAGLARQYGNQDEWFGGLLNDAGSSYRQTGLNYALYNLVYRDGPPYETSPGYNFSWVVNITTVAEALNRAGYAVYDIKKMARLYDGVLDIVNIGKFTPSLGDSGAVRGGLVGREPLTFQRAYRALENPRYQQHLQSFGATGEKGIRHFESLFVPLVTSADATPSPVESRLLDGYGMAILNNPANTVSLALYYGYMGGHGHYDRLHFELFANDQVMMPDLGYPDFMNAYVPGIFTWSKNTINHNTVMVDAKRQATNRPGTVNLFVDEGFVRALDIDATATYPQTSEYRRRSIMVDMDDSHSYLIDCFTVKGGTQHDYSLHGPPGEFTSLDGNWSEPAPGTLAGPEVALGQIYDDARIAPADYTGSYGNYKGSGFQHFVDVQRAAGGPVAAAWSHNRDQEAKVQIHLLEGPQEFIHARAQVSPVKHKEMVDYYIARNKGEDLSSRFVSLIEPYREEPWVQSTKTLEIKQGTGIVVEVRWQTPDGRSVRDVIFINQGKEFSAEAQPVPSDNQAAPTYHVFNGESMFLAESPESTDAAIAVARFEEGKATRRWSVGGNTFLIDNNLSNAEPIFPLPVWGKVTRVDPESGKIHVACHPSALDDLPSLVGKIVHFENAHRRTAHPIKDVQRTDNGIVITTRDDLRVGRVRISAVDDAGLSTPTGLAFAPVYKGTYATNPDFTSFVPVKEVAGGRVTFAQPETANAPFIVGEDAWLVNVGPGDTMEIPLVTVQ